MTVDVFCGAGVSAGDVRSVHVNFWRFLWCRSLSGRREKRTCELLAVFVFLRVLGVLRGFVPWARRGGGSLKKRVIISITCAFVIIIFRRKSFKVYSSAFRLIKMIYTYMCTITPTTEIVQSFLNTRLGSAGEEKLAVVLVGGPGSGKSSGKSDSIRRLNKSQNDFVNIDPDEIITTLFENDNNCRGQVNSINDKSFEMAIQKNKNIIFDGTGKDFAWYSEDVLKRLKNLGYNVNLVIVANDVETVLGRIKKRAQEMGRDVSESYTRMVYSALNTAIPEYLNLDCSYANSIFLYDNSGTLKLIYKSSCQGDKKTLQCAYSSGVCLGGNRKSKSKPKLKKTRNLRTAYKKIKNQKTKRRHR